MAKKCDIIVLIGTFWASNLTQAYKDCRILAKGDYIMKMKKLIVIVLIILVVISCLVIWWHCINNFIDNQKMLEQDEIIEIFEENKEHFVNVKESMSDFKFDWDIRKNAQMISDGFGAWKGCAIKGKLYLAIRRSENYEQLGAMKKTAEEEESIKYVLNELGFKGISSGYGIDFTQYASTGNVSGVIYCVEGSPTRHPYAHKIVDLGDSWYYYETRPGDMQ